MFCCSAERVAKNCAKIKTVAAAMCCAKHAEIISCGAFCCVIVIAQAPYSGSVVARFSASASSYKEESLRFVFDCIWQTPFAFAANNCIKIKTALGGFAERAENVGL